MYWKAWGFIWYFQFHSNPSVFFPSFPVPTFLTQIVRNWLPLPYPQYIYLFAQVINCLLSVTNLLSTPATSTTCHLCPSSLEPRGHQCPHLCKEPLPSPLCFLSGRQLQARRGKKGEVKMTEWYEGRPLLLKQSEDGFSVIGWTVGSDAIGNNDWTILKKLVQVESHKTYFKNHMHMCIP